MTQRTYRNWIEDKDLLSFVVKEGESDLFIRADKDLSCRARQSICRQRSLIQEYIKKHPEFAGSLEPLAVEQKAPGIVKDMSEAGFAAGVGPMAAVAGAVAEYVGRDLLEYSKEVIIENGGDIFIKTDKTRKIGIFAGKSCYTGKLALEIPEGSLGICASSGTVGHSLSYGKADAAVAVCPSAILADAWATRIGNMVGGPQDIEKTLDFIKNKPAIEGLIIVVGDKIGVWGKIKLIRS
ncbi:MAG: UPF0280 family protein [Candidatus Omnitrophica bacterium]|nr:UPF0280 family protein [Candidatus Omnitrophota bacterium]